MKRVLASALILGSFSLFGLAGCGEKSEVQEQSKVSTPGGETTVTKETEVKTSGEHPPAAPTTPETPPVK